MELEERFWSKVDKAGDCWLWTGARDTYGYGQFRVGRKTKMAHRLVMGDPKGKQCLHRCDTPHCVNPDHIFLGSHADNMRDMAEKGRSRVPKGENHKMTKITEKQARMIKNQLETGAKMTVIAKMVGVTYHTVSNIKRGSTWKHLN